MAKLADALKANRSRRTLRLIIVKKSENEIDNFGLLGRAGSSPALSTGGDRGFESRLPSSDGGSLVVKIPPPYNGV